MMKEWNNKHWRWKERSERKDENMKFWNKERKKGWMNERKDDEIKRMKGMKRMKRMNKKKEWKEWKDEKNE